MLREFADRGFVGPDTNKMDLNLDSKKEKILQGLITTQLAPHQLIN